MPYRYAIWHNSPKGGEGAMTDEERGLTLLRTLAARCVAPPGAETVGVYAHGSLTLGCFRWDSSDLDFLLVTGGPPTQAQKEALAQLLLKYSPAAPPKGLEMSAVRRADCAAARPR